MENKKLINIVNKPLHAKVLDKSQSELHSVKTNKQKLVTETKLCSKHLKTDDLCQYIECKLNKYLSKCEFDKKPTEITIRCLNSKSCNYKFEALLSEYFNDKKTHFCIKKLIAAFATIDDNEIMFFAFDVVHLRNLNDKDIIYLSLLDSVRYLEPTKLRKKVYQNIVSSYFEYCGNIGFKFVYINPMSALLGFCVSNEYIFSGRHATQKLPDDDKLLTWYKEIFDDCLKKDILDFYKLHKVIGLNLFEIKLKVVNKTANNKLEERIEYKNINGVSEFYTFQKRRKLNFKTLENSVIATRTIISHCLKNEVV